MKGLDTTATARAANMSPTLVATYQAMYQEAQEKPQYRYRFTELTQLIAGASAESTSDGKKGAL
jgi:hypothetical protein